jgi:hypothetical protein
VKAQKSSRGVAIFAKAFMGIPAQQAAKATRPLMPAAAPAVLLLSLDTQQGVSNIILAMTRRDFGKPAFSLRKKRFVMIWMENGFQCLPPSSVEFSRHKIYLCNNINMIVGSYWKI